MLLKSQLGRKRSRAEILADKEQAAVEKEQIAENARRIEQLESLLIAQDQKIKLNDAAAEFCNVMMSQGAIKLDEAGKFAIVDQQEQEQYQRVQANSKQK